LADGVECGLHRIERLMRLQALRARPRLRRLPKEDGDRQVTHVPANLLDRQFVAERPNQKWIADFTYIWTAEGWLYVSAVIDLFSRRVVGWSMSASMKAQLVADALLMAVWWRGKPDALMHHSDRGKGAGSGLLARSGIRLQAGLWKSFRFDPVLLVELLDPTIRGKRIVQSWPVPVNGRLGLALAFDAQAIPLTESALCPKIFNLRRHELVACQWNATWWLLRPRCFGRRLPRYE
jgi:transposase InsO family protein